MKYIALFFLMLSGCASISEYNMGCRDGVTQAALAKGENSKNANGVHAIGLNDDVTAYFCDMLDAQRRAKEKSHK